MRTETSALDTNDTLVSFKLGLLERALPASSVVVFGDMWRVDEGYTKRCAELGSKRVLLIDMIETVTWSETREAYPAVDFYKGDFSNAAFMASISETFESALRSTSCCTRHPCFTHFT
jgi:hypothetical protein